MVFKKKKNITLHYNNTSKLQSIVIILREQKTHLIKMITKLRTLIKGCC